MSKQPKTGKIGVTSENIFPIIKKFLYSEQDIFLRELVSNAVDATSKLKTIARLEEGIGEIGTLRVDIAVDEKAKTLTISDNGVGMTAEEIDKYINQIAFSGAEDFLKRYEASGAQIIGHFGLGFYSAFMVADKVEIDTLSYKEGSEPVHWSCDGTPEFQLTRGERSERGTTITLHLASDSEKYLQHREVEVMLDKYCRFLPIPIFFGKKRQWQDGKMVDTDEDNQVNDVKPLWLESPSGLQESDYLSFYHQLYPGGDDPLFYIHLNVDYPFTLRGILYFPLIKESIDPQRNRIHLYCNQVFVTDQVEGVVPEWLYLLEGIIDSPDIPLNVSRSYLQQDANAQKITAHIGKKVADALTDLYKTDRKAYEAKWKGIGLFVNYGMLTDDKAYERLKPALLLPDTEGTLYTLEEYKALVGANQTDKDDTLVLLYATDAKEQYMAIQKAIQEGYNVLLMDGPLATPLLNQLEQKEEKIRFARVDSDTLARLIPKDSQEEEKPSPHTAKLLEGLFLACQPKLDKVLFSVETDSSMGANDSPLQLVTGEWMRRMKEMSRYQVGGAYFTELPDSFSLKLNPKHKLLQVLASEANKKIGEDFDKYTSEIDTYQEKRDKFVEEIKHKSEDELSDEEKASRKELTNIIDQLQADRDKLLADYTHQSPLFDELWDLALLAAGLLEGERLHRYLHHRETHITERISSSDGKKE